MSKLWYRQPAKEWEEALPLGNGRLGAMIYGDIEHEHLQMNEDSMWYGGKVDRNNPDMKEQEREQVIELGSDLTKSKKGG